MGVLGVENAECTHDLVAMRKPGCVEAAMTAGLAQLDMISSLEEEQRTTTSLWFGLTAAKVIFKNNNNNNNKKTPHTLLSMQKAVKKSGWPVDRMFCSLLLI